MLRSLSLSSCQKEKLNIDPDSLLPKLPDPSLLKPFPTNIGIVYEGHEAPVIALSVSTSGQFIATGDQIGWVIIWDVLSSRKLFTKQYSEPIHSVDWSVGNLLAFSHGDQV